MSNNTFGFPKGDSKNIGEDTIEAIFDADCDKGDFARTYRKNGRTYASPMVGDNYTDQLQLYSTHDDALTIGSAFEAETVDFGNGILVQFYRTTGDTKYRIVSFDKANKKFTFGVEQILTGFIGVQAATKLTSTRGVLSSWSGGNDCLVTFDYNPSTQILTFNAIYGGVSTMAPAKNSLRRVDDSRFVMEYYNGTANNLAIAAFSVDSNGVITRGNVLTVTSANDGTGGNNARHTCCVSYDATKVIATYATFNTTISAKNYSLSGITLAYINEAQIDIPTNNNYISAIMDSVAMSDNSFVVYYSAYTTTTVTSLRRLYYSVNNLTQGAYVLLASTTTYNGRTLVVDTSKLLVTVNSINGLYFYLVTIDGPGNFTLLFSSTTIYTSYYDNDKSQLRFFIDGDLVYGVSRNSQVAEKLMPLFLKLADSKTKINFYKNSTVLEKQVHAVEMLGDYLLVTHEYSKISIYKERDGEYEKLNTYTFTANPTVSLASVSIVKINDSKAVLVWKNDTAAYVYAKVCLINQDGTLSFGTELDTTISVSSYNLSDNGQIPYALVSDNVFVASFNVTFILIKVNADNTLTRSTPVQILNVAPKRILKYDDTTILAFCGQGVVSKISIDASALTIGTNLEKALPNNSYYFLYADKIGKNLIQYLSTGDGTNVSSYDLYMCVLQVEDTFSSSRTYVSKLIQHDSTVVFYNLANVLKLGKWDYIFCAPRTQSNNLYLRKLSMTPSVIYSNLKSLIQAAASGYYYAILATKNGYRIVSHIGQGDTSYANISQAFGLDYGAKNIGIAQGRSVKGSKGKLKIKGVSKVHSTLEVGESYGISFNGTASKPMPNPDIVLSKAVSESNLIII